MAKFSTLKTLRCGASICSDNFFAVLAVLCAVWGCQLSAGDGHPSNASSQQMHAQQEISAQLNQYTQALLNRDLAALDRIWSEDLTFINPRGMLLGKKNRMDNIKNEATAFKSIKLSEVHIRPYGLAAVATFQVALEAQYSKEESSGNYRVTTVWERPKGTWQLVAVQMTRVDD